MISLSIEKIGVVAQGINNWPEASALLQGEDDYQGGELPPLKPSMLKPNERRRTTRTIKIALQAAEEALQGFTGSESLASVFSSSEGDLDIIDQICLALTEEGRPVSPTQFHNSVHNAPAGYWSIGAGARQGS
ncbi:MAG: beta-ketoacyl synthase chain length factor, partial [Candidatus Thiodiazotropha taylori]